MNKASLITVGFVVVAAASLGAAISMRRVDLPPPTFEDTGELLFEKFSDPNVAASLSLKSWDTDAAQIVSFSVELKDGIWVIPSHNNYPADGTERMGKAAASFIDIRKDIVRSNDPLDHAKFGVLDPEAAEEEEGRGQRITISDESGTTLVDIIVGKAVPDKDGYRFVRYPDKPRVYAVKISIDISTNFVEWIEKDLLKLDRDTVVQVISNSYHVDEKVGAVADIDPMVFAIGSGETELYPEGGDEKAPPPGEWAVAEGTTVPAGKELNATKVKQVFGAASRVKIVGVRPRPARLNPMVLLSKGFFVNQETMQLYGNEGQLDIVAKDGVIYTLYFGEVTYDTGLSLTAGGPAEVDPKSATGEAADGDPDKGKANRYMFVMASYDEKLDQTKDEPPEEGKLRGKDRAEMLADRFGKWFYVIDDSSFTQMHKDPADFWRDVDK